MPRLTVSNTVGVPIGPKRSRDDEKTSLSEKYGLPSISLLKGADEYVQEQIMKCETDMKIPDKLPSPPPKRMKVDYSHSVQVIVGTGSAVTSFNISEVIICESSGFFRDACLTKRKETIRLQTVDPNLFQIYVHFIYKATIDHDMLKDLRPQLDGDTEATKAYIDAPVLYWLFELYNLADRLQNDECLQRSLIEVLQASERTPGRMVIPDATWVGRVYDKNGPASPLRALMIHSWRYRGDHKLFRERLSAFPVEFKDELLLVMLDEAGQGSVDDVRRAVLEASAAYSAERGTKKEKV